MARLHFLSFTAIMQLVLGRVLIYRHARLPPSSGTEVA
jgi:hypothetical protein